MARMTSWSMWVTVAWNSFGTYLNEIWMEVVLAGSKRRFPCRAVEEGETVSVRKSFVIGNELGRTEGGPRGRSPPGLRACRSASFSTRGRLAASVFRPWRSFPTMVSSGLVIGFVTGGFPSYSREISQLALALGMTFAMTEISFANISARTEFRRFVVSLVASYGALSGLLLIFALLSPDPGIHDGWVLMASVPPAIALVPITSYLRGDTRRTVVSLAILYLIGLLLV